MGSNQSTRLIEPTIDHVPLCTQYQQTWPPVVSSQDERPISLTLGDETHRRIIGDRSINSGNGLRFRDERMFQLLSGAANHVSRLKAQDAADGVVRYLEQSHPVWIVCERRQMLVTVIPSKNCAFPNTLVNDDVDLKWSQIAFTRSHLIEALDKTLDPAYLFDVTWSDERHGVNVKLWLCREGHCRDPARHCEFIETATAAASVTNGDD